MNSTLSFRKESILRSSRASESLSQTLEAQGLRASGEQRPYSVTVITTSLTATQ